MSKRVGNVFLLTGASERSGARVAEGQAAVVATAVANYPPRLHATKCFPALAGPALGPGRPACHPGHAGAVLDRYLYPRLLRHRPGPERHAAADAADAVGLSVRLCLHEPFPRRDRKSVV